MNVAIICNHVSHINTVLGLVPNNPNLIIITPDNTLKMYGYKNIYYYPIRPLYARELKIAEAHGWKLISRAELYKLLEVKK